MKFIINLTAIQYSMAQYCKWSAPSRSISKWKTPCYNPTFTKNSSCFSVIMTANIILGVRLRPTQFQRIKLDNVDLESKVVNLKEEAAKKINLETHNFGEFI